jgi:CheY-like chemotaxis protein
MPTSERPVTSGARTRPTVLVVDDEPLVLAMTARAIAEEGYPVLQAGDALSALGLLQGSEGDDVCLVVTDIVMPGLTGDALGRLLRTDRPTLPVLYMSGYARPHFDFLSEAELSRCWLPKPFSVSMLVAMVRELCGAPSPEESSGTPAQSPSRITG